MLTFTAYGKDLNDEDVESCYSQAESYIYEILKSHGDGPVLLGPHLYWTHNSVAMSILHSSYMSYSMLTHVLSGIQNFQLTYGYFETYFDIVDRIKGIIGAGGVHPNLPVSKRNKILRTLSNNGVSPTITPTLIRQLPPRPPFLWPVKSNRHLILNFTSFGHAIDPTKILICYLAATRYVAQKIATLGDVDIPRDEFLDWTHESVSLTVQHTPRMKYGILADVIAALEQFQSRFGYTTTAFYFSHDKLDTLGAGLVGSTYSSQNNISSPWTLPIRFNSTSLPTLPALSLNTSLARPIDPTIIHPPSAPFFFTLSNYGHRVPPEDYLFAVLQLTQRIIVELLKGNRDASVGEDLDERRGGAVIVVRPEKEMTWTILAVLLDVITNFMNKWGWLSLDFEVSLDELGGIGNGFVSYI